MNFGNFAVISCRSDSCFDYQSESRIKRYFNKHDYSVHRVYGYNPIDTLDTQLSRIKEHWRLQERVFMHLKDTYRID